MSDSITPNPRMQRTGQKRRCDYAVRKSITLNR